MSPARCPSRRVLVRHIVSLLSAELDVPVAPDPRAGVLRREDGGAALILAIPDPAPESPLWLALTSYEEASADGGASPDAETAHLAMRRLLGRRVRFVLTAEFLDEEPVATMPSSAPQGLDAHPDADATGSPHPVV